MLQPPLSCSPFFLDKKGGEKIKKTSNSHALIPTKFLVDGTRKENLFFEISRKVLRHEVFDPTITWYEVFKFGTPLGKLCMFPEESVS